MAKAPSPARAGTVAITAHLPKEVRDRLKILAVEIDRTMNDLIAEALEDLFAKHSKRPRSR
jgi:predicted transcriptional regulator